MKFFLLDGVPFVNHPQGLRAAAGGDFLPSPPHEDDHADSSQHHVLLDEFPNFVIYQLYQYENTMNRIRNNTNHTNTKNRNCHVSTRF